MCFGAGGTTTTNYGGGATGSSTPYAVTPGMTGWGNYSQYLPTTPISYTPSYTPSTYTPMSNLSTRFNSLNNLSGVLGGATAAPAATQSWGGKLLSTIGKIGQSTFGGGTGGTAGTQENQAPWWVKPAMMAAGYMMPQPESNIPSGQELLAKYKDTSTSTEGAAAKAKMLEFINNPEAIGGQATQNYVNALNTDFDAQDAQELAQFKSDWTARGYNTYGSDYNTAMNNLTAKQAIRRNTATSAARANLMNTQVNAQLEMIAKAYGVDQQLLQDLMTLDVQIAAQKYGLDVETVNQFRKAIYDMALGVNTPSAQSLVQQGVSGAQSLIGG